MGRHRRDLAPQRRPPFNFLAVGELSLEQRDCLRAWPAQRDAARQSEAHGAADRDVDWRAGNRITGATHPFLFDFREPSFRKVRQFEIVKEQIEKFLAGQDPSSPTDSNFQRLLYSSWRRSHVPIPPPSLRPFGVRSRIA